MTDIVAVTGAEGFIGSHLVERCAARAPGPGHGALQHVQFDRLAGNAGP